MFRRTSLVLLIALALISVVAGCSAASQTTTSETASTTTMPEVDKEKFSDVWRALMEVQGATTVGVVYSDFGPLVQGFVTELSLLPQDMTNADRVAALALAEVAQAYSDSLALWGRKIKQDSDYKGISVFYDGKPLISRAREIVDTYGLTVTDESISEVVPGTSIQVVWAWAAERTDRLRPLIAP